MRDKLEQIKKEAEKLIKEAVDQENLRQLEIKYLGRKGELTRILRGLADISEDTRKEIGALSNKIKSELQELVASKQHEMGSVKPEGFIDVTLPGLKIERGHQHPITLIRNELEDLFLSMGFQVLDGPELESDYYNFTALNIPENHPARDMQDTFYIDKKNKKGELDLVMRTHTSPMQVRAIQKYGVPLKCVVPGRVFRSEALDACHEHTFDQMEGLMIGEGISLNNLIAVMKELINGIFKKEMETRVRPGFFPFVEPGIEMDIRCTICGGEGCPSCKHSGWLELLPAGMIHPNVIKAGGQDPEKYQGFAFGLGFTRLVMMRYGVEDIRHFNSGDLRFLEQF
jgi:phenylalanyl-tRNA synthetase alpha chain